MSRERHGLGRFLSTYLQHRYTFLFYILLLTLVTAPVLSALKMSGTLLESMLAGCLVAALLPVETLRSRSYLVYGMVILWLARLTADWLELASLGDVTLGIWTLIGLFAAAAALRFAMKAAKVDAEHLYAALSAYLLAGLYFGLFYWVLERISAGSFSSAVKFSQTGAIYFSFVTLATLGYGDIVPQGDIARGIAIVEGVGGQLFLAVLVARLVSLYSKTKDQSD